ncbi:hypothetical protein BGX31_011694 [Mortierella sp. GBA43]|nr:hypothetical protein BGX31_011694 [Mortierella sp. GBA43]
MASSAGSTDTLSLNHHQQQQLELNHFYKDTNTNANGSVNGMARYQQDDAIVPIFEAHIESADEDDDEFDLYVEEHEQHPRKSQEQDITSLVQIKYDSVDDHEDVDEVGYSTGSQYLQHRQQLLRQQQQQQQLEQQQLEQQQLEQQHLEQQHLEQHQLEQQQQQQQQQQLEQEEQLEQELEEQPNHHQHQHLEQIQQQYQQQQQQNLQAYKSQAMNIQHLLHQEIQDHEMSGDESQDEEVFYQHNPQHDPHRQHLMDTEMQLEVDDDFDDEEEGHVDEGMMEEDVEGEGEGDVEEESEVMSLTEEDIDFNLVYAFHTFVATQEGQASVVRNDSLVLLEDTNVYWWLVRVLKTGVIGYIPAENIETPFERLARLNTYRNVATTAPSAEWGTFDEHVHPLDAATLQQRANRRSVIFSQQNEYLEASETEWTDDEDDVEWYEDGPEDFDDGDELDDEDLQELEADDDEEDSENHSLTNSHQGKSSAQLEAERGHQEALKNQKMDIDQDLSRRSQDEDNNRTRKSSPNGNGIFHSSEPRVISITPLIARDEPNGQRSQTPPGKAKTLRLSEESLKRSQSPQQNQSSNSRSSTDDDKAKKSSGKDSMMSSILGKSQQSPVRKSKEDERSEADSTVAVKKPSKFKSLFGVGKSSKDKDKEKEKERKEKEKQEKEKLKNTTTKGSSTSLGSSISSNLFRARSNSNGSVVTTPTTPTSAVPPSPIVDKPDPPNQEFMTLRVYPGNVDFGASQYKTVVITPATMASEVAHQAVIKFRLAPDGTASTGDFFLTVKGVDGDETVLQPTDKPMTIYQSLTAHLTTPLPENHRLSISSVSSMVSVHSSGSGISNNNASNGSRSTSPPGTAPHPTLRRSGSGRFELQPRSIRFHLNKKIRRPASMLVSSLPTSPTTPTAPQEDFFWVKVVCQAQDLPQSMLFLDGLGIAMEKSDPRAKGQSLATKAEHWIGMQATSNAGDVIFKMLENVGIRFGVVDGVPEHVVAAKRSAAPDGLVYEYQLALLPIKKQGESEEIPVAPQTFLSRCFEENRLAPIRRSPKADVASMPPHPGYIFFLRKSAKSLQAEMRLVQEQLQRQQQEPGTRKVPPPLHSSSLHAADLDSSSPAHPSPTPSITSVISPTSPGPQTRNFNAANAALMNASRIGGTSPVRVPRRTDSVIMSPTGPLVRANSFDSATARQLTSMQPQSNPRTLTPDRLQQQPRARSASVSQSSPTPLARPLQAPSPAPSNLSSHAEQQEGSRPTTPEKSNRPERQRATSPPILGPSPLSLSTVVMQAGQASLTSGRKGSFASVDEILGFSGQSTGGRLNLKRNETHGVDVALTKGIIRSSRITNAANQIEYQYTFVPFEGGEEIDISEIIEDVLGGGDSDDEQEDQQHLRVRNESPMGLENMSRRERMAAAVARASQVVADGKERRKANASSNSTASGIKSRKAADRDRLEQLGNSARGPETLLKLERALAIETSGPGTFDETADIDPNAISSTGDRNLPSPMSLSSSSPPSPTLTRKVSDAEVHVASVTSIGRMRSTEITVTGDGVTSPTSPLSPPPSQSSGFTKATLLPSISVLPSLSKDSSPVSPPPSLSAHHDTLDTRSYSPLPRPLQSSPRPRQLAVQTNATDVPLGPLTASAAEFARPSSPTSSAARHSRSRSASTGMAETSTSRLGLHGSYASESAADMPISPTRSAWLLTSDYNKGMQELLTLVRGGRSSSVSSTAISMDTQQQAHDQNLDDFTPDSNNSNNIINTNSSMANDKNNMIMTLTTPTTTTTTPTTPNHNVNFNTIEEEEEEGEEEPSNNVRPMMWLNRSDRRLRDVQNDCHPEVFECWKEVDADLDKVEKELDSLLATVKATIF